MFAGLPSLPPQLTAIAATQWQIQYKVQCSGFQVAHYHFARTLQKGSTSLILPYLSGCSVWCWCRGWCCSCGGECDRR